MSSLAISAQNEIDPKLVSSLEFRVLQEYAKLATLLRNLIEQINKLKNLNSQQLSDNLRILETKLSLVFTLFKGGVYSLFLQANINSVNKRRGAEQQAAGPDADDADLDIDVDADVSSEMDTNY